GARSRRTSRQTPRARRCPRPEGRGPVIEAPSTSRRTGRRRRGGRACRPPPRCASDRTCRRRRPGSDALRPAAAVKRVDGPAADVCRTDGACGEIPRSGPSCAPSSIHDLPASCSDVCGGRGGGAQTDPYPGVMHLIHTPSTDLTYDDCFFLPNRSAVTSRFDVDLASDDGSGTTIPLIAANMTAVTGRRMAEVMARRGGLAVLPQDLSAERIDSIVRSVKSRDLLVDHPLTLTVSGTPGQAADLLPKRPHGIVVVVDDQRRPLGTVSAEEIAGRDSFSEVGEVLSEDVPVLRPADLSVDPAQLHARIAATHHDAAVVVDEDGVLRGVLTATGVLRSTIYRPATDARGRLRIAVAVGVNADVAARVRELVEVGADVIVLDTAHGHQDRMIEALRTARGVLGPREGTDVRLAAGNIVTAEGTRELIEAGADIVK